jgi:O-methyltransferase/8-demethyl-8-(2,3-dimethoxy-alpha-L-rhamnosyl)tetracenomycin-C 4'-O-methyltransferase
MDLAAQYLNLLELTLTGAILDDIGFAPGEHPTVADRYDPAKRMIGRDWPQHAQTMIGLTRLRHLRQCVELVLRDSVPGDFIETGVWRGGACIFMRAILFAYGVRDRRVWVADSFAGLPPPTPEQFPADTGSWLHTVEMLAVSLDDVHRNFMKYGMLDDQVVFLKGWFKDTLPNAAIERLAVLRLDGDMYESTMDALTALYHKVSECGFVIIDDYNLPPCREAVTDFRASRHIVEPIEAIDLNASFWRKSAKG